MASEFESGFFARNLPAWHGLGKVVKDAPTSEEAIRLAVLDWDVVPFPISAAGKEIPNMYANVRTSDNSVLGVVTGKYKIVQNDQAFNFVDALVGSGNVTYDSAGSLRNGKTIWLLVRMEDQKILGDDFENYLCFTNSHDGKGSVRAMMTPTRVVCMNTLNMAIQNASRSWSIKHMGNMEEKLNAAKMSLGLANLYITELNNVAEKAAKKKLTDTDISRIIENVFPINPDFTERQKETMEINRKNFASCINVPDLSNFKNTAWGVINAAADYVDHVCPNRLSQNYRENNWGKIVSGHMIFDKVVDLAVGA